MRIAEINFPGPLLNALRDGELVVFAGAGVSMGEPASLPSFKNLAKTIAKGTGKTLQAGEEIDHFLGRLQHDGVKVHERAAEILSRDDLKATELHQNLLQLYPDVGKIRVVTTNFDSLFEQATEDIFGSVPEVFRAPALPSGSEFNGIVHLHGAISHPDEMVITIRDFGYAYLTGGSARRFLIELFSNFIILFVGYSYGDTIMNYLTDALPGREDGRRFALIGENDNDINRWYRLGIEPITYPQSNRNDHSALNEGVCGLADLNQWKASDWERKITMIAKEPPPLDEETGHLIEYALGDSTRTRFFTKAATDPKWIDWLDERDEYLTPLFGDSTLNRRDKIFSWWLIEQFAYTHANKLFLLIGKYNMHLHPDFWHDLAHQIGVNREFPWDKDILSRWVSLLLAAAQGRISTNGLIGTDTLMQLIGERCIQHGISDSLLQIFDVMMEDYLRLKPGFSWPDGDEDDENPPVDVELSLIGKDRALSELWEKGLKPKQSQVAEPLLNRIIKRLEDRYITLCVWQQIHHEWDSDSRRRSAIETHEQSRLLQGIDVLIDVARDCLEWIVLKQPDEAEHWCNRLVHSDAPLLRRLAVHGISKREDLTADDKIDWLLTHTDLHERPVRHEVFRAVQLAYPKASLERRQVLIRTVRAYRWPNEEHSRKEEYTAEQHFDWFDWLDQSDPNCTLARQALDEVLAEYPNFKRKEYSNPMDWIFSDWEAPQSPWTPEQLLENPASHWLDNLLSFQITEEEYLDHGGIRKSIEEAIKRDFDWGLDLANALDEAEKWDVYVWAVLINTWSRMNLDEDQHSKVLGWLGKTELYPKHSREVSDALYALVKHDGPAYALNLLPQANEIAATLWCRLDRDQPIEESDDWLRSASSHPAGSLAHFWLFGFLLWRDHQDPKPTVLSEEYCTALSRIMNDRSLPGKLGRTVLANLSACLLAVDKNWAENNLLPLFAPRSDDFYAVWDGFLTSRVLNPTGRDPNPTVAKAMADWFFKAVEQINSNRFNQRDQFIKDYIDILTHFVEDPIDEWIPKLFQYASPKAPSTTTETTRTERQFLPHDVQGIKTDFALEVCLRLQVMDESAQQEWWQRWLKRYWKNRLQGVPAGEFESGEVANMLDWLPHLGVVFPEAVDLAVRMPQIPSRNCWIIAGLSKIDENDLWQSFPKRVAKLLIYLWGCNFSRYDWRSARDLIDNLLSSNISSKLKEELEEIKVQL